MNRKTFIISEIVDLFINSWLCKKHKHNNFIESITKAKHWTLCSLFSDLISEPFHTFRTFKQFPRSSVYNFPLHIVVLSRAALCSFSLQSLPRWFECNSMIGSMFSVNIMFAVTLVFVNVYQTANLLSVGQKFRLTALKAASLQEQVGSHMKTEMFWRFKAQFGWKNGWKKNSRILK